MISELWTRLRFLVHGRSQSELADELRFHVEHATEANMAAGMTTEEARRQAMIEFGGVERTREQCHEQRPGWWIGTVAQDVHYALRGFRPQSSLYDCSNCDSGVGDRRDDRGV